MDTDASSSSLSTCECITRGRWGANGTLAEPYSQEAYPLVDLRGSFCRNPYDADATTDAKACRRA